MPTISRRNNLVPNVVFVDGLSGSGKTALLMALSSLDRVEMCRFDHIYEYVSAHYFLKRMPEDSAISLIRTHADLACYNSMIGRSVNFRPGDITCVLNSPKKAMYLERLELPDREDVLARLDVEKPILHIMTHQALGISEPIFTALRGRMSFIEIVRHPLYLIGAWHSYIERYGADPLSYSVCYDYEGVDIPWFAYGWEKTYLSSNKMDRCIRSIEFLTSLADRRLTEISKEDADRIIRVPFERFVVDPGPYLDKIENLLGAKRTSETERILKEQNIPRKIITDVPDKEYFNKYGSSPLKGFENNESETEKRWNFVKEEASAECLEILTKMSNNYEKTLLGD